MSRTAHLGKRTPVSGESSTGPLDTLPTAQLKAVAKPAQSRSVSDGLPVQPHKVGTISSICAAGTPKCKRFPVQTGLVKISLVPHFEAKYFVANREDTGMKLLVLAIILSALTCAASPADVDGLWRAEFLGPVGDQPKMDNDIRFELRTQGQRLTGKAHFGNWPGDAPIVEGKIEGDRISFTLYGTTPWTAQQAGRIVASGFPKLTLTGTVSGREMKLTLFWDSVMLFGPSSGGHTHEMRAIRKDD